MPSLIQNFHVPLIFSSPIIVCGFVSVFAFLIFTGTYLVTTCRFYVETAFGDRRYRGLEPPNLPYWIPWIGRGLEVATNPHKFYETAIAMSPGRGPIKVRVASLHMYMITGADNIQTLFRNSKDLTFEFMQIRVAQTVKGLPEQDATRLSIDNSGTLATPLSPVPEKERIWRQLHNIYAENLAHGRAVDCLTSMFVSEFSRMIDEEPRGKWKRTQVYKLLQDKMFRASTMVLAGPGILESNPGFAKKFWQYDAGFMKLLLGNPRFACRQAWDARDHCLEATKRWLANGWAKMDWQAASQQNPDWEPNFGHRLVRAREQCLQSYGVSLEGRASLQMGLIWAINGNAIPMAAYMLIEMIHEPSLLSRVRDELSSIAGLNNSSSLELDVAALCRLPLLGSVYKECLRLRASIPLTRRLHNDIEIDGYTLRAGNFILAPSWLSHQDEKVWSVPGHPPNEFWADRFLHKGKGSTDASPKLSVPSAGRESGNAIKAGDFFPFGGGSIICPGRFFAKQEILTAVALIVTSFDIEFVKNVHLGGRPSERGPGLENCESRGIISLDRDVMVRMRRRS
ncbi:hypothetical protein JX265_005061 [Neoarthrinium moseri]|uniref:Cytochrome P450 n=1 Tax=Neoarthrinium moseri TaxID=1658444 RepID=A0A9P9WP61_9PEZI|nr:hypothetical protein JX266_011055 [Neoarthrinium moseri]KAI1873439.1 hypothetical protein JX265_005061 [Neoarthrinium moseri]